MSVLPQSLTFPPAPPRVPRWQAKRALIPALAFGLAVGLGGCGLFSAPLQYRGQSVTPEQLSQLVPGTSTEADVRALLGDPTNQGLFDPNRWAYIGQVTQNRIGRFPAVRSNDVVVLTFNDQGVLEKVDHLDKKNAVQVGMASGATPSPGGNASFFQQLLGSIGRYTPTGTSAGGNAGGISGGIPGQ
ncbi:MAG TPA: outer membrane protein assembly factor BamE [Acetobacteraceae bacterium]|nr:outer membrane protein assembly factor BamE [Acetobacteraceae bacterium]